MKATQLIPFMLATAILCFVGPSCRQEEEKPLEEIEEKVDDALDQRPGEPVRDAVEETVE